MRHAARSTYNLRVYRHWLLVVLALASCKSSEQKLLDANRDEMVAKINQLKALAPLVDKQERPAGPQWPVAGAKVGQTMQVVWANKLAGSCNAMFTTYAADNSGSDYIHMMKLDSTSSWLEIPICAVEGNKELMVGLRQADIDTLVAMKFALVLKPTVKEPPHVDRAEAAASVEAYMKTGEGTDIKHFAPGLVSGDALLYELETGKLAGNFPFAATSSAQVEVGAEYNELVYDLNHQLEKELAGWLAK